MTRVALKGLAKRKLRALLTGIAIVLGVAMISGSFVLTDTIDKAFDSIFTSAYRQTDAVVSGKSLVDQSSGGGATVSPALLGRIQADPDVAAAAGSIVDMNGNSTQARLIDRDGKVIQTSGNPNFGIGVDPSQPRFNPMRLVSGRWAVGRHEVVIDDETARKHDFTVGDTIEVAAQGPRERFTITGTASYGDVSSLGGATFAIFSIPTAQAVLNLHGYSLISVAAKRGVAPARLVAELKRLVPANVQVKTAAQQAKADKQGISGFLTFIRGFLLAFGGIALFVGSFVIFNTLSITVAQRTRELATLRTLGASRRQVRRIVVLESLVIGLAASTTGLFAGFGLAKGLSALFKALGLQLPQAAPVYALRTVLVSLLVGVGVTVVAGLGPAFRATRVPPISAVREGAVPPRSRRLGPIAGAAMLVLAVLAIGYAVTSSSLGHGRSLLALAVGTLLLLAGVAGVASRLVAALAAVVGIPARRLGGAPGRLAAENAVRNPSRTAATAAALMIGLALVSFVAVLGSGVHGSVDRALRKQVQADWVVSAKDGWSNVPAAAGDALAKALPGVRVSSIRGDRGVIGKASVNVNAVDAATLGGLFRFGWKQGSDATLARLGGHGAVLKAAFASKHHLRVGDAFTLRAPNGTPLRLHVLGLFQLPRVYEALGGVVVSTRAFDRTFPRPGNALTLVGGGTKAQIERALAAFPDTSVESRDGWVKTQSSFLTTMLNMLYVLLALSVVVSLFGMVNTLVLSVFERTRELGMLRAVGMSRRQARRMVRHESVITSLIGAALGLPLGIALAAAVTHALSRYDVAFAVPVGSLAAFVVVAVAAGLLAAIAPARRAGKLDVLAALQYE